MSRTACSARPGGYFVRSSADRLTSLPNLLSLSRLPLAVGVCATITLEAWPFALGLFTAAAITDTLDGWLARRWAQSSAVGRTLDPLADKVLLGAVFVYLLRVPAAGLSEWMVAVLLTRELMVTGLRGMVEAVGIAFGADRWGKLKTLLQCGWVAVVLGRLTVGEESVAGWWGQAVLLWAMLGLSIGSGLNYTLKASRLLG